MLDKKNVDLFISHKVYNMAERTARHEVYLENYCKVLNIEALTMLDMARKDILPAMSSYSAELAKAAKEKSELLAGADCSYETETVKTLCALIGASYKKMEGDLLASKSIRDKAELANYYKSIIIDDMRDLRISVDEMETLASSEIWPYPSYGELLFGVR